MKKTITLLTVAGSLAVGASSAQAVNCHSFACLNRAVNRLQRQVNTDQRVLATFFACTNEFPASDYGPGYLFDQGAGAPPIDITALDVTAPGDTIGAWVLTDTCNSVTTNTRRLGLVARPTSPFKLSTLPR